ncbi:uncharacterized protein Rv2082 [Hyalella azteca]|uniref:Uncharacterized protein Rv2082 n=1 Tax=Hyalella azteca TaxID=294128 RepID=A0A8B7N4B0_HYAAZ|nr:uncharacterized protein Rv2082 [Hyalella azteca]
MDNLPYKSDVEKWNVEHVAAYIQSQVGDYSQAFLKRGIDGRSFLALNESSFLTWASDLPIRSRQKINKLIRDINSQPSSAPLHRGGSSAAAASPAVTDIGCLRPPALAGSGSRLGRHDAGVESDSFSESDDDDDILMQEPHGSGPPTVSSQPPPRPVPLLPPSALSALSVPYPRGDVDDNGYLIAIKGRQASPSPVDQADPMYEPVEDARLQGQRDGAPPLSGDNGPPLPPRNTNQGGETRGAAFSSTKPGPSPSTKPGVSGPSTSFSATHSRLGVALPSLTGVSSTSFKSDPPQLPPLPTRSALLPPKESNKNTESSVEINTSPVNPAHLQQLLGAKKPTLPNPGRPSDDHNSLSGTVSGSSTAPGRRSAVSAVAAATGNDFAPVLRRPTNIPAAIGGDPAAVLQRSPPSTIGVGSAQIPRQSAPDEGDLSDAEEQQESVRLSDGSRVDLTPLYKSLVQRDYFHLVSRKRATELLLQDGGDGAFVLRPSSQEHPLTLSVACGGGSFNV